jgi:hypothetical protein
MPTPLSLGHGIQYHRSKDSNQKSLAVVIGWMGAKQSQMKPYLAFYHKHGVDTLSFAVGPAHVLFPDKAMTQMQTVLKTTVEKLKSEDSSRNVIFHCFSMGGYLYGQALRSMHDSPDKYGVIKPHIKAQIFDSPPDYNAISDGVAKSIGYGGVAEKITAAVMKGYLHMTKDSAGVEHRASSHMFHNNPVQAPALWYYSRADPVARWDDCETVINKWRAKGTSVDTCTWIDSPHIQHGRKYPEEYFGKLKSFLLSNNLL